MFKNVKAQPYCLGFGVAVALVSTVFTPVSAQSVIIINGGTSYYRRNDNPTVRNFIYGSPISTPVPVNPVTGNIHTDSYYSKPHRKRKVYNSTITNPVLVNPVIIQDSRKRRGYRKLRRRSRQPASRIIIYSPQLR